MPNSASMRPKSPVQEMSLTLEVGLLFVPMQRLLSRARSESVMFTEGSSSPSHLMSDEGATKPLTVPWGIQAHLAWKTLPSMIPTARRAASTPG